MRLSGFSLLGLLVALAIVAALAVMMLGNGKGSANGSQGSVGAFQNAISQAQQSVHQQDQAATAASQSPVP